MHVAAILALYAIATTQEIAEVICATDVYLAVTITNLGSGVLARVAFSYMKAIIAPMMMNGRCTQSIPLGFDLLPKDARCVVSNTVTTLDAPALYVINGTMALIAYRFYNHHQEFQLFSLANAATCGTALTCVIVAQKRLHHRYSCGGQGLS